MNLGRYLLPGEHRVVALRRHPAMLGRAGAASFAALVVALLLTGQVPSSVVRVIWLAALAVVAWLVSRLVAWRVERFVVTDQRVLLITGVATRRVAMLPLRRVTDMTYERSPMGRLLGYGEFIMESAGSEGLRRVTYVPVPDIVYRMIADLLFGRARLGTGGSIDGY